MTRRKMKLRIVNKTRLITALSLIAILAVSCVFGTVMGKEKADENAYIEYTVTYGDTLWSIAEKHNYAETDVRKVIYSIEKTNALAGGELEQGRTILIPVDL